MTIDIALCPSYRLQLSGVRELETMNDDMRTRLIKLMNEKVSHRNELEWLRSKGIGAHWEDDDGLDIDQMIARENEAIDNLERAIARLS